MHAREWLNNNSVMVTACTAAVLVVSLVAVAWQTGVLSGSPKAGPHDVYYWDMSTGTPFVASSHEIPPIQAPSGGQGVRAHLFSCGECDPETWFGYLETYTPEAKEELEQEGQDQVLHELIMDRHLIRSLDGERWVLSAGEQADLIMEELGTRCQGAPLVICRP